MSERDLNELIINRLCRLRARLSETQAERDFYRERCHSLEAQITQLYELAADAQRVK